MKLAILIAVVGAIALDAQERAPVQIVPPGSWLFPQPPMNPSVGRIVQGLPLRAMPKQVPMIPRELKLQGGTPAPRGLCSVPLLEAHVDVNDSRIAVMPPNSTVAIPQARVPAPPCAK